MSYIKQVEQIAHEAATRVHQETVDLVHALQERIAALEAKLSGGSGDVVETATKAPRRGRLAKAEPGTDAGPEPDSGEPEVPGAKQPGK